MSAIVAAEMAVVGALLSAPRWIDPVDRMLTQADFLEPKHATIYQTMLAMHGAGQVVDPVTVLNRLTESGQLQRVGGAPYLHTLFSTVGTASNVEHYALIVRDAARARRAVEIGMAIQQAAENPTDMDGLRDVLAMKLIELEMLVDPTDREGPLEGLSTWDEFITRHGGAVRRWVVPQVISASDVWMVLAPMGAGKTTLSRQIAWCVAAGINPFNPEQTFAPKRSLVIDLENDPGEVADESSPFLAQVKRLGTFDADRAQVWERREGINLRKSNGAKDLERAVAEARPDIVCIGSLNNAYQKGNSDWDTCADEVRAVLNRVRKRYGCALWLEHHMAKGALGSNSETPYGSMIWAAWATHGRVLSRAVDNPGSPFKFASPFRGDRGKREMPIGFTRGGRLPWTAIHSAGDLELLTEACQ